MSAISVFISLASVVVAAVLLYLAFLATTSPVDGVPAAEAPVAEAPIAEAPADDGTR